jgi:hypothetical protein
VVKAQVPAGGRGKAGGIGFAADWQEASRIAGDMHGRSLNGRQVQAVYVEQRLDIRRELYLALAVDRDRRCLTLLVAAQGGVDVEELPEAAWRASPSIRCWDCAISTSRRRCAAQASKRASGPPCRRRAQSPSAGNRRRRRTGGDQSPGDHWRGRRDCCRCQDRARRQCRVSPQATGRGGFASSPDWAQCARSRDRRVRRRRCGGRPAWRTGGGGQRCRADDGDARSAVRARAPGTLRRRPGRNRAGRRRGSRPCLRGCRCGTAPRYVPQRLHADRPMRRVRAYAAGCPSTQTPQGAHRRASEGAQRRHRPRPSGPTGLRGLRRSRPGGTGPGQLHRAGEGL